MKRTILVTTAALCLAASGVLAKGHDQGQTDIPGVGVGAQTVGPAQSLGGAKGNRPDDKGPINSPAIGNAGR
ncbi:hypothetical protein [Defluviimonas sp. WL0075]|uniref:Lipoprotein n=1 Tax=Albidovulum sediminicola TaxID=2984331 RepID=A0ABT2Z5F5_9RHOB|nr:hypothetical protein [Defluviimonas sp. WL0075]MCV2866382.1 hypothetical protein [Defluviimonas sp. WL0075]